MGYSEDFRQRVVEEYLKLGNVSELSRKYGIKYETITDWICKSGVKVQRCSKVYSEYLRNQVVNDFNCGLTYSQLSDKYNISKSTLRSWLYKYTGGVVRNKYDKIIKDSIMRDYYSGVDRKLILSKYGIKDSVLKSLIRDNGSRKPRTTCEDKLYFVNLYRNGYTLEEVAEFANVSKESIIKWVERYDSGQLIKDYSKELERLDERKAIARDYVNGMKLSDLKVKYRKSNDTLVKILKELNVYKSTHYDNKFKQNVVEYSRQYGVLKAASHFDISESSIKHWRKLF